MKTNSILSANYRIFKVRFMYQAANNEFICYQFDLAEVLKTKDINGVESIKEYDPATEKFKRVSKKTILKYFEKSKDENYNYLKNHYFFS